MRECKLSELRTGQIFLVDEVRMVVVRVMRDLIFTTVGIYFKKQNATQEYFISVTPESENDIIVKTVEDIITVFVKNGAIEINKGE